MEVDLFVPCFIDQFYPETAFNCIKILKKAGVKVIYNPEQTCCGQPSYNSGFFKETKTLANKFLDDFTGKNLIVTPSASCAGFVKNYYPTLFESGDSKRSEINAFSRRMVEFSDFMVNHLKMIDFGAEFPYRVTFHDSCAALREYKLKNESRILLNQVKGLQLIEMEDTTTCCGFGGTFMAKYTTISSAMAEQKVEKALATGAEYIVSTDSSCLLNIESYITKQKLPIQTIHLADILASGW